MIDRSIDRSVLRSATRLFAPVVFTTVLAPINDDASL
jgi:hypothetical protein